MEQLFECLHCKRSDVKAATLETMTKLKVKHPKVLDVFSELTVDTNVKVRVAALRALGNNLYLLIVPSYLYFG